MVDLTKKKTLGEYETGVLAGGDTVVTYRSTNAVGEKVFRGDIVAGTAASIAEGTSTALKMYSDKELKDSLSTGAIPVGTKAQIITGADTTAKLYKPADINGAVKDIAVAQYAGRTAMKAATGLSAGDVVYLSEGGRSGPFEYLVGDYSAEVAADPLEGVYVALDSDPDGSEGVLKRRLNGNISLGWFVDSYNGTDNLDSEIVAAGVIASMEAKTLIVPYKTISFAAYPNIGDVDVFSDGCTITNGYPRAKTLTGFIQSGVPDGYHTVMPSLPTKDETLAAFFAESGSKVWAIIRNAERAGGKAIRLRSSSAPSLSGSGDIGSPHERIRQDLIYNVTKSWAVKKTSSAESGSWSDSSMVANGWPDSGAGTNLLQAENMRRSTTATDYIEYSVTTDSYGFFNVALYQFSSACDSVVLTEQASGIQIADIDLSANSEASNAYTVFRFKAPFVGVFTLRLTNSGVTNTDLRVIGVNLTQILSDNDVMPGYDFLNFARTSSAFFNSGSAATPVYTVRQNGTGGAGITGGSIHGGETLSAAKWVADGELMYTGASPTIGDIYIGKSIELQQESTITWPDAQEADYSESMVFSAAGSMSIEAVLTSSSGLRLQNAYTGMAPIPTKFDTLLFPKKLSLGSPGASDSIFYPSEDGEAEFLIRSSTDNEKIRFQFTTYPDNQSRMMPGATFVNMAAVTDGYCKMYSTKYFGADLDVDHITSRSILTYY